MLGDKWQRWERVLYIIILLLAIFSRFYILGERAISHDESIHTKFSWNLYNGDGFQHNPMMHGPLLFEATALIYTIFGVNDYTSRVFVALVGVALVMSPVLLRKWMGKKGALVASALLLISPSISYYSRYIRHDIPLVLTAILLLWMTFKYIEDGLPRWLYWFAAFFSLMYTTKEASYIYTAIYAALLCIPLIVKFFTTKWDRPHIVIPVVICIICILAFGSIFVFSFRDAPVSELTLDDTGDSRVANVTLPAWGRLSAAAAFFLFFLLLLLVHYGVGEKKAGQFRVFDLLIVIGSLSLPLGSAFLMKYIGAVDMDTVYEAVRAGNLSLVTSETLFMMTTILLISFIISIAFGLWWNRNHWLVIALIHYSIFFVAYTTIFTWGFGAVSGLIGGLAYWLAQQGVKRGNQPYYYYLLIGLMYEYLPVVFSVIGGGMAVRFVIKGDDVHKDTDSPRFSPTTLFPLFLTGWTILSWLTYTWAGEKMPWLYVHIALPSILLSAWAVGQLLEKLREVQIQTVTGLQFIAVFVVVVIALIVLITSVTDLYTLFRNGIGSGGPELPQLQQFGKTIGAFVILVIFSTLMIKTAVQMGKKRVQYIIPSFFVLVLALLTVRTSILLNFINYDMATELMVYAHGTPDIKVAMAQIEEISWRVTGSPRDIKVAYGEDGSWPMTWYMVDYPNNYFYSSTPDADTLVECPVIIAGSAQYGVVSDIIGDDYIRYDYKYLWWPIQDYYDFTPSRILGALGNPEMLRALWQIVWNRDYTSYAALKNPLAPFTLQKWPYRKEFRLYVRKDLANEVWSYKLGDVGLSGLRPVPTDVPDPFSIGERNLMRTKMVELPGAVLRGMALAQDGTMYVADTGNHRIWHLGEDGAVLDGIGSYGIEPGQFIEPWDVAVDENGYIYVADTWNHRIQKFAGDGTFVTSWGSLAQVTTVGDPTLYSLFYGPRGITYNGTGELFITDTGNKRVQVFDTNGTFLREFGGIGVDPGYMDEPVGIDIGSNGWVGVVDTWNQRIQFFTQDGIHLRQWKIPVWDRFNPDEKPYIALSDELVFVSDAIRRRVLAFDYTGGYKWALSANEGAEITFPQGMLVKQGVLWIADAHEGRIFAYELPE